MLFWLTVLSILGHAAGTIATDTAVSRSEALLLIYNSTETPVTSVSVSPYPDAPAGQWFTPYMLQAVDDNIIEPDSVTGLILPHKPVTRAEFCKMLSIAYGLPQRIAYEFIDVPSTAWYTQYIGVVEAYNLFNAEGSTHVFPERLVTATEAVEVITQLKKERADLRVSKKPAALEYVEQQYQLQKSSVRMLRNTPFLDSLETLPNAGNTIVSGSKQSNSITTAIMAIFGKQNSLADSTKLELLGAINAERQQYNLPALLYNSTLDKSAQAFAQDMWKRGYFSHFTPEGESFVDRIRSAGYMSTIGKQCGCTASTCSCDPHFAVGENIAKGQYTVEQVVREWMASPGHRKNILQTEYSEVGFGVYNTIWVQNFGRIEFRPVTTVPKAAEPTMHLELVE